MVINIIIALIIIGGVLWLLKWWKTGLVLIGMGVVLYGAIVSAILPEFLMNRLQSPYSSQMQSQLEDNVVFVVFGMGTQTVNEQGKKVAEPLVFSYGTIFDAASMYHQCKSKGVSCKFITSGADVAGTGVSEAASIAKELEKAGVDPAVIIKDEDSRNSWMNAKNTAAILRDLKPSKVVLLQSAPLIKRDLLYLAHFGVHPEPVAAAYLTVAHTNLSSAGLYFLATDLALHEEIGVWRYAVYEFMGWNEPRQPPLQLGQGGEEQSPGAISAPTQ
ncbi:YdcF family protein [Ochrobactrum sp. CM-21-5]|nr:YdcF family protein [Ochrobactrum sp. CM-21-5]MBC2884178.1 YdcF family protein [Ochrobactrum sp. CM-21-5]